MEEATISQEDASLFEKMQMDDDESLTREEALAKVSMILAKTENSKIMTDITIGEVGLISALSTVADTLDYAILKIFEEDFRQHRVSKDRQGRKEILEIASEARRMIPEKMNSWRNRIFGGRM